MMFFRMTAIVFCFLVLSSCGEKADNPLAIEVYPDFSPILPGTTKSCLDAQDLESIQSIKQYHVGFSNLRVVWDDEEEDNKERLVTIQYVSFRLENGNISGGEYETLITGDDLDLLIGGVGGEVGIFTEINSNRVKPLITGGNATVPACSLKVGGIPLTDEDAKFSGNAIITVLAVSSKAAPVDPSNPTAPRQIDLDEPDTKVLKATTRVKVSKDF